MPRLSTVALAATVALLSPLVVAVPALANPAERSGSDSPRAEPRLLAPRELPELDVEPRAFAAEAAELPSELTEALARDVGISGAEYLAQEELAVRATEVTDALEAAGVSVEGSTIDGTQVTISVATERDVQAAAALGVSVTTELPEAIDLSDVEFEPAADLYGGAPYFFRDSSGGGARCSAGFPGISPETGVRQVITAGHCLGNPAEARRMITMTKPNQSGFLADTIGLPVSGSYAARDGWDFGLISVDNAAVVGRPGVLTWGFGQGAPLEKAPLTIRDAARVTSAGATMCKSGSTTGWTCGEIIGFVEDQLVGAPTDASSYRIDALVACITVDLGDSGGAGVLGSTAIGVTSATGSVNDNRCGSTPSYIGLFTPLHSPYSGAQSAQTLYGSAWEPLVAVARPAITSFSGSAPVYTGDTLTGTLSNGRSRHRVEVVIDGGPTRVATVTDQGTWSVDISDLPSGEHTYSIVGRWGQSSASSSATGTWLDIPVTRLAGANRYDTAAKISRAAFPTTASTVFIANGLSFPDALSAGPAATELGAPLLLTGPTSLATEAAAELVRLSPTRIIIVGGTGVVSSAVESQLRAYGQVERWAGANRYETSRTIADRAFASGASTAYIATGAGFPDALSAGAAAAGIGAPVVLVPGSSSSIDTPTIGLLDDLGVTEAIIAGGTGVVSSGLESSLRSAVSTVRRLAGTDRYATSLAINVDRFPSSAPAAYLTSGTSFPDALAGSVLAGLRGAPMYISPATCVRAAIADHLMGLGIGELVLLGGTGVLGANVAGLARC